MSILALTYLLLRFVHCSSFVRLLFVFSLSARAARTVICSFIVYLPVVLRPHTVINLVLLAFLALWY